MGRGGTRGRARGTALRSTLVTLLLAASTRAAEGDDARARALFDEGVTLERAHDFAGALTKFEQAHALRPTTGVSFHRAYALQMTGRLVEAARAYASTGELARAQGKADVADAVTERLAEVDAQIARLAVTVPPSPREIEVRVDGAIWSHSNPAPAPIEPGEHVIRASAVGHLPFTLPLTLARGQARTVAISLSPAPPVAPRLHPPPRGPVSWLPILTAAGAVTFAAAGAAAFFAADSAAREARSTCPMRASCDDERTTVRTLDAVALSGFVIALGLGVASAVLFARHDAAPPALGLRVTPAL